MSATPYLKQSVSGIWYVHWTTTRVGKRVSTKTKDHAEAATFFARWLARAGRPLPETVVRPVTLGEIWAVYDEHHVYALKSIDRAVFAWQAMKPSFEKMQIDLFNQTHVDAYKAKRLAAGVKSGTVRTELAYLVAAINFAAKRPHRLIDASVATYVLEGLNLPAASPPRGRWLLTEEVERLRAAARSFNGVQGQPSRVWLFIDIALETAARKQAILDLTWDRVDFGTGMIDFEVPGDEHTSKRRVSVPMSERLDAVLTMASTWRASKHVLGLAPIDYFFSIVVQRAGLGPDVTPHTLRHTAATNMARRGVPLHTIAGVLGNSIAVVEKTYAKHCPGALKAAVDTISGE